MQESQFGTPDPTRACSALSEELSEPLAGTAAVATSWLCVEQPGPWGAEALAQSRMDTEVGSELARRCGAAGVRPQLIRRPGRHPFTPDAPRRVLAAHTAPGGVWLRAKEITDPAELLDLDFRRLALGEHDGWGAPADGPLLLVCTNGRRDRCCAVHGRALLDELAGRHEDSLWETTHTGGHRFAPAAVLLPSGYTYGRLGAHEVEAVLSAAAAGKVATAGCRGRSAFSGAGQAAELAVREAAGEYLRDSLDVEREQPGQVTVRHRDGRRWAVRVRHRELEPPRPNSCGKSRTRPSAWIAEQVHPAE